MKNRKLSIRISEADLQTIHHKAEEATMTLTEYVTACCLDKEIVIIDGLNEVIRQQKGIGRNLNQLTTLANMGKVEEIFSDPSLLKEAGLNTPAVFRLAEELRARGVPLSGNLYTVEGVKRAILAALS